MLNRFFEPLLDWVVDIIISIGSGISTTYSDGLYLGFANSSATPTVGYLLIFLLAVVLLIMPLYLPQTRSIVKFEGTKLSFTVFCLSFAILIPGPFFAKSMTSESIRMSTVDQIAVIKPYTNDTDKLYSQFLLVQTKDDYIKVWGEIMVIAQQENVVLPAFEKLSK